MISTKIQFVINEDTLKKLEHTKIFMVDAAAGFNHAIEYCERNSISASSELAYAACRDGVVYLYFDEEVLHCTYNAHTGESRLTPISLHKDVRNLSNDKIENMMAVTMQQLLYFAAHLHQHGQRVKSTDNEAHKFATECLSEEYDASGMMFEGDAEFMVNSSDDGFTILCNGTNKIQYTIPSELYPMANDGTPLVFHNGNTQDVDDDGALGRILDTMTPLWDSTKDSMVAHEMLVDAGYTKGNDVKFYTGWMLSYNGKLAQPESWLVVNGKSIISVNTIAIDVFSKYNIPRAIDGEWDASEGKKTLKIIRREHERPRPFTERCFYGKPQKWLYIGTESTPQEAAEAITRLDNHFPDHPKNDLKKRYNLLRMQQEQALIKEYGNSYSGMIDRWQP